MNLIETRNRLREAGVEISLELGEHIFCRLDSNCPLAIKMRRIIREADIPPEKLVETIQEGGFALPTAPGDLTSKIIITFMGKEIEVEAPEFGAKFLQSWNRAIERARGDRLLLDNYAASLQDNYRQALYEVKKQTILPQLSIGPRELASESCFYTGQRATYSFYFKELYNPVYLVKGGIRFKITDADVETIRSPIWLCICTTPQNTILMPKVLDHSFEKFIHYHGDGDDCWGTIKIPEKWDRTFKQIANLKRILMGSLATINLDSLMRNHPKGEWPDASILKDHSTRMGREGQVTTPKENRPRRQPGPGWSTEPIATPAPQRWRVGEAEDEDDEDDEEEEEEYEVANEGEDNHIPPWAEEGNIMPPPAPLPPDEAVFRDQLARLQADARQQQGIFARLAEATNRPPIAIETDYGGWRIEHTIQEEPHD